MKNNCVIYMKYWFFRNYWWLITTASITIISFLICTEKDFGTILTTIGGLLSLLYFIQKQKLDEMRLHHELFKDFNVRYDDLNDKLIEIAKKQKGEISLADYSTVIDYFNLCGEEYFYYNRGYIDPIAWKAWRKGMCEYSENPNIKQVWQEEKGKGSYYGLYF